MWEDSEGESHKLWCREGHEQVDQKAEEVRVAELHPSAALPRLLARVLQGAEEHEAEHVLVIPDLPNEQLHPRRHNALDVLRKTEAAQRATHTPVVGNNPKHPVGIAAMDNLVFKNGGFRDTTHSPQRVHDFLFTITVHALFSVIGKGAQVYLPIGQQRQLVPREDMLWQVIRRQHRRQMVLDKLNLLRAQRWRHEGHEFGRGPSSGYATDMRERPGRFQVEQGSRPRGAPRFRQRADRRGAPERLQRDFDFFRLDANPPNFHLPVLAAADLENAKPPPCKVACAVNAPESWMVDKLFCRQLRHPEVSFGDLSSNAKLSDIAKMHGGQPSIKDPNATPSLWQANRGAAAPQARVNASRRDCPYGAGRLGSTVHVMELRFESSHRGEAVCERHWQRRARRNDVQQALEMRSRFVDVKQQIQHVWHHHEAADLFCTNRVSHVLWFLVRRS
mmetsp:Transcript_79705/g.221814  ORF Transcript_79705/g.221814 Transcript_79705/m.221814 type:complete len:448 (-) Transcript_79705:1011-2354(-)